MSTHVLKRLSDKIDDALRNIETDTAMGKAKDHGEYKYGCGIYRGLLNAKSFIIEVAEQLEDDE